MDLNPLLADGEGAAPQVSQPSCPQKSSFDVLGICCSSEVPLIENILKSIEGVKEVSVIVPTRTVIVIHDSLLVSQLQIVKALNQARLEANVRVHGERKYQKKWPNPFAMACGVLLLLSFLKYAYHPLQMLAVGAVVIGIWPILLKGYAAIRNFRLDVNILMLIAVIGSVALKDYTEAGIIVFLFTIADWLDSRASHKAIAVMSSLISLAPQKAVIAETGEEVDADEVETNTILAVKAGEVIPIDGVVVDGKCEVDEKTLTGESLPVTKEKDSTVWAGTINLNGYISIRTTAVAEDCVVAKMAKLVEEVQNSKSTTQRFIDKCAQFYTPAIIIISAAIAVIPPALRVHNLKHWFHLALVVLVTACPCALILSTPVASFCALTKAATSGLLVKGSDYLEILSKIKIVAFDKTGTLTRGEFVVTDFRSLKEDISLNTLLYWVSSIESKSSHPMAAALVEYGRLQSIEPNPETVENYENFPGEGIYGRIDGRDIYIGSRKISVRANGTVPNLEGNMIGGKTIGYVFSGQTPVGAFSLSDACRTGAAEAVDEIRSMGIKAVMLTGDNQASAMHVQEQLGNRLDIVHAELLPEDKARFIKEFKDEGPTAMIGDGINDAPALATADIGISMGISGSALATETGHVILMSNDVRKIPTAIKLARKAHRKVIENVILSISTKVAILALAFAGHPLVWAAVLADVGTCLLVICNSMLLLREKGCKSSSAASLADKHGCKTGHSHSSHSHGHHHNNGIVQKPCETKQCSSQSCASKSESCQSSSINSCKSNCNQGSCKTTNPKTTKSESQNCCSSKTSHCHSSHSHGHHHNDKKVQKPCKTKQCSSESCASKSEPCQSSSINSCKSNCNQGSCKTTNPKTTKSESQSCCSSNQNLRFCSEEDKHSKAKHCDDLQGHNCCENHTNNSTALRSCVEKCCCSESESLKPKAADSHSHLAIDITMSPETEACRRLEKRDIGGCCKSYRKECCGKHGHFGGGLTEIIITE